MIMPMWMRTAPDELLKINSGGSSGTAFVDKK